MGGGEVGGFLMKINSTPKPKYCGMGSLATRDHGYTNRSMSLLLRPRGIVALRLTKRLEYHFTISGTVLVRGGWRSE